MERGFKIPILDHGYVKFIESMGTDESVIESARMSTGKGFFGWYWEKDTYTDCICATCKEQHIWDTLPSTLADPDLGTTLPTCTDCWGTIIWSFDTEITPQRLQLREVKPKLMGKKGQPRDLSLLEFMYMNRHMTPFESGELMIEVYAPIMVYREWHRHRTQSYNEFSARYSQMPNEHYVPDVSRIQKQSISNKQGSSEALESGHAFNVVNQLKQEQKDLYGHYDRLVRQGVAKEVARINTPVSRYSKMRAKTDVRNWLGFLGLRMEKSAQLEIRQYANAVAQIIKEIWPKTFDLFIEHDFLSVRFSRTEMRALRALFMQISDYFHNDGVGPLSSYDYLTEKQYKLMVSKLTKNKEDDYKDVLAKLGY